jgi:hypothetical protein
VCRVHRVAPVSGNLKTRCTVRRKQHNWSKILKLLRTATLGAAAATSLEEQQAE